MRQWLQYGNLFALNISLREIGTQDDARRNTPTAFVVTSRQSRLLSGRQRFAGSAIDSPAPYRLAITPVGKYLHTNYGLW